MYMLYIPLGVLIVVSIAAAILFYVNGNALCAAAAALLLICVSVLCVMTAVIDRDIVRYVTDMNESMTHDIWKEMDVYHEPILVASADGLIVSYNKLFGEKHLAGENSVYGTPLADFVGQSLFDGIYSDKGVKKEINGRLYLVRAKRFDSGNSIVSFSDITDYDALLTETRLSAKSVMYIAVDSYEVMTYLSESRKSEIRTQIEKKLEEFFGDKGKNGILHKLSDDRFCCIIEERDLEPLMKQDFPILKEIKSINIDEFSNVTVSIGVGRGEKTLADSEKSAKEALKMCLDRGGDQAAVSTKSGKPEYFGGFGEGAGKSSKVKARIFSESIKEIVSNSGNIYITGHQFADFDSLGASLGLCEAFRSLGKNAWCVLDLERNQVKSLIEHVKEHGNADFFKTIGDAQLEFSDRDLLIVCDTHDPKRLDAKELYAQAKQVAVIDHHRKSESFISNPLVFFHELNASSTCEMVTEMIEYFGKECSISSTAAEALLAGIMLDTKNFVMRAGARTFEAAAYLRRRGADTVTVKKLFSGSVELYQEKCSLIQSAELFGDCAVSATEDVYSDMRTAGAQAADELLGITGVNASFVIFPQDGKSNISARSLGQYNVQLIMEALGGGGTPTMAAAQPDVPVAEAKEKLIKAIEEYRSKAEEDKNRRQQQ